MSFSKALWTVGSLIGAQQLVKAFRDFEANDLLGLVGIQRRRSAAEAILPVAGLVSLGAIVGAGAALLLAPMTGHDLRQRLSDRVDKLSDKLNELGESYGRHSSSSATSHETHV